MIFRALFVFPPFVLAVGFILWMTLQPAFPHEAPTGWSYPYACCAGDDCRELSGSRLREGPAGYVMPSGEVVSYQDRRIKHSPDGLFHWCTIAGTDTGRTICLFVPPRSF